MATEILLLHGLNSFSDTTNKKKQGGCLASLLCLLVMTDCLFLLSHTLLYIRYKQERKS